MTDVTLTGTVCDKDHGGEHNTATFYGHPGRSDVCIRAGRRWFFDIAVEDDPDNDEMFCLQCDALYVASKGFGACCTEECSELHAADEDTDNS
jgi:hypothetical protein